jgi:drug/metabolite transporter (DMT)-like permease
VALLTGFVGIVLLVSRDLAGPGTSPQALGNPYFSLFGTAAVLLACVFYAFSAIYARRTTHEVAPQMRVLIPLFGADLALWAVTSVETRPLALPGLPLTWVAMVWLGILGVAVASSLYYYLIHSVGPTRAALVTYVFPLVGVALGVVFLDERLDWNLAAGAILIVGSIIVVNR